MTPEFVAFPKIARLNRECIVTEKLDGTNGIIHISDDSSLILAGSRNRWLSLDNDNFGFAAWVEKNKQELITGLGPGTHYGEWWGQGVGRRYGLAEKRFSLFNVSRWTDDVRPACCHVVPELARGLDIRQTVEAALQRLRAEGSVAAPGFQKPEGVVVYHTAAGVLFKVTLEKDESPKGKEVSK